MKKLYRSEENRVVAGVIGGVGEYYHIDPVIIRVIVIIIAILTGIVPMALAYLLSVFVIPRHPGTHHVVHEHKE